MRNFSSFALLSVLLLLGCDRLKKDEVTKVQIQFPANKSGVATSVTAATSTGFTGAQPINCYIVAAGGPEEALRRNVCKRKDSTTVFQPRSIGPWSGAAPAGGTIALDVPSGSDRVIYVVGMYASDITECRDFKTYGFPNGTMSDPYLLGEVGGLQLKSGETVDVAVPLAFSDDRRFDGCDGPDFPAGGGGGGGGTVIPTKLAVNKQWFPYDAVVENTCQSLGVTLVDAQGRDGELATPITVTATANGNPISLYADMTTCGNFGATSSQITIPANTRYAQFIFRPTSATANPTLNIIANSPSIGSSDPKSIANVMNTAKAIDLRGPFGPNRLLPNVCYPYDVLSKSVDGTPYSTSVLTINYTSGTGFSFYSDNSCNTPATSINIPSGHMATLWGKTTSTTTIAAVTFSASGYLTSTVNFVPGSGTTNVANIEIRGDNMGPMENQCYNKPYEVSIYNEDHTAVVATGTPFLFNFMNPSVNFDYTTISTCTGPQSGASIPVGSHVYPVYIKPRLSGVLPLGVSATNVNSNPYNITVQPAPPPDLTIHGWASTCVESTALGSGNQGAVRYQDTLNFNAGGSFSYIRRWFDSSSVAGTCAGGGALVDIGVSGTYTQTPGNIAFQVGPSGYIRPHTAAAKAWLDSTDGCNILSFVVGSTTTSVGANCAFARQPGMSEVLQNSVSFFSGILSLGAFPPNLSGPGVPIGQTPTPPTVQFY